MMTVGIEQDVKRHAEVARRLPGIGAALHQPGRCRMPERMGRNTRAKAGQSHRGLERRLHRGNGLSIELHEVLCVMIDPVPPSEVRKQARRDRHRRLPLVGLCVALAAPVVNAALQIDERAADCRNR